jgi:DNA-binding response OmpR family regulator
LLACFAVNPKQILSNDRIIDIVWADDYTAGEQVKLLVGRLRKKLATTPGAPEIETVRGFGYRLQPNDG